MKQLPLPDGSSVTVSDADYELFRKAQYMDWDEIDENAAEHPETRKWLHYFKVCSYHREEAACGML